MSDLYVVTGTSKGLGRAIADALAENEQNVVIEIGRAFSGKNTRNTLLEADFSDLTSIELAFAALSKHIAAQKFTRATLINNAGVVAPIERFDRLHTDALTNNLMVNLAAPMVAAREFATRTRECARERLIVGISSGAAKRAVRGWSAYCAAKAGLEMACRIAAEESRETDPTLTICTLAPGVVDTPMQAHIRATSAEVFPEVSRFRDMKQNGVLRDANAVARDIISLLIPPGRDKLQHGGNVDIRELIHARH